MTDPSDAAEGAAPDGETVITGDPDTTVDPGGRDVRLRSRLEFVATVLLALATVLTAWSAFQANKWNGIQQLSLNDATAARTEVVAEVNILSQFVTTDQSLFLLWLDAELNDRPRTVAYLEQAFSPEFKTSFDRWRAEQASDPTGVNPTPFDSRYFDDLEDGGLFDRGQQLEESAGAATAAGSEANRNSDNYVLVTVLVSLTLFFAGIATKFSGLRSQLTLLGLAGVAGAVSIGLLVALPVAW